MHEQLRGRIEDREEPHPRIKNYQSLYSLVPSDQAERREIVEKICRKLKIHVEAYRTWRTTPRGFEINNVSEPPSPLAALMPPIVRKLLATP